MELKLIIGLSIVLIIVIGIFSYFFFFRNNDANADSTLKEPITPGDVNILFLHHSTGNNIWNGGVKDWFDDYNQTHNKNYTIVEQDFPKRSPYGWKNYPFDYWNIWVNNAGSEPYKQEPTLEMITKEYDVVIWKHCFPVSNIKTDIGNPRVSSEEKRLENYKLQYQALKEKMKEFPDTKFIVWTPAALVEPSTTENQALRTQEFYNWVKDEWDEKNDNIFLWDFYILETEGGLYLTPENAQSPTNSHPSESFSKSVAPLFCQRIIDVIQGDGDNKKITGKA